MILLTGASGFIGTHLHHALISQYGADNVLALTSNPIDGANYLLHNNYQFEPGYFVENNYAGAIDIIIHAGAYTPKNASQANDFLKCNQNIYSTEKLLSADLPNLQKVIYLSTLDIYGKADVISESSPVEPVSLYGYSKLYGEKMIAAWANEKHKKFQVLRVGHVYGPGEENYQKIIPVTMKNLISKKNVQIWGSGKEIRSFIYIKDVVEAILNAINLSEDIGPVNLVSGNSISISELVNQLISISGSTVSVEHITSNTSGRDLLFDNSKLKEHLLHSETALSKGLTEEWHYMNRSDG
jgi:nucleoside-diphosphate-sugar epimerase